MQSNNSGGSGQPTYSRIIDFVSSPGGDSVGGSSFVNIAGMTNIGVVIPITGTYRCEISWVGVSAAALVVPSITVNDSSNEVDNGKLFLASSGQALRSSGEIALSLTAGTVNFRPQWRRSAGGSSAFVDEAMTWYISISGPVTTMS